MILPQFKIVSNGNMWNKWRKKKKRKNDNKEPESTISHCLISMKESRILSNGLMADKDKWFKPGIKAYTKEELVIAQKPEIG